MKPFRRSLMVGAAALAVAVGIGGIASGQVSTEEISTVDNPVPAQSSVWDSSLVHSIDVSLDQADYDAIVQEYYNNDNKEWIEADVTIDGQTFPQAGMRLKGNSSLMPPWADVNAPAQDRPWLIRLDKFVDQDLDGYTRFAVRSPIFSDTYLNEALSARMIEEAGLAATETFPTSFSVNGSAEQLRLVVEEPDNPFDLNNFGDDGGTLYKKKVRGGFEYLGDDPDTYEDDYWEPKGGDEDNWQPLFDFLDWMNNSSDEQFAAELDARVDTDAFAHYLAIQDILRNWDDIDGPGQNGYLRATPPDGQMTVVAWDHNLTLGLGLGWPAEESGDSDLPATPEEFTERLMEQTEDQDTPMQMEWGFPLLERAWELPEFRQQYDQSLAELDAQLVQSGRAEALLNELSAPLAPSGLVSEQQVSQEQQVILSTLNGPVPERIPNGSGGWPWPPAPGAE
jgi:spore coat protein CotH